MPITKHTPPGVAAAQAEAAAAQAEAQRLADAAAQRQAQNDKAHQVRLDNLGKRDPVIKKLLVAHRQQAADLATAKASLASVAGELDAVKSQAAADAAASSAELAALRQQLAEALKKAKPAGGQ